MKNVLIRIFSTITLLVFIITSSFGTVSEIEFEEIVDKMICDFTDLSLKEQRGQPNYQRFKDEVKLNCTYYTIRPFLRELKPVPSQTLEIVNLLHIHYKEQYNSRATNQELYNILTGVFEEESVNAFARSHTSSFPTFKADWEEELRERFMLNSLQNDETIDETLPKTEISDEFDAIQAPTIDDTKAPEDFNVDPAEELPSSSGLGNSFLLFGFLLLLIAFALYFLYQKNKGAISKRIQSKKTPTQPQPQPRSVAKVSNVKKITSSSESKSKSWFSSKPKKETYADKIAALQILIQNQKNTLLEVKEDIFKMHNEINDLTEKAGFEIIDEHIKQLSQKLDAVEQKQKELILALDTQGDIEETDASESETSTDLNEHEALLKDATLGLQTETLPNNLEPETVTESNFSHEIPVIQIKKLNSPPDLFFMPIPNKDGSFDVENWTAKFEDTESVYRFEMINNYEAKFQFYNEKKTVKRAISGYDIYVKPVCKALNAFNTNATEIKTQVHGVVYRDGDMWRLKEPALIYYQ